MLSRWIASRVSRRAVIKVVAVESVCSNPTHRSSRAVCSPAASMSGSQCRSASWMSGFRLAGIRFLPPVTGEVPVHEPGRAAGQGAGGSGDLAGLPGLQGSVLGPRPQSREPEARLEGVPDQQQPGLVGQVQRGGELLDRVLGDLRCPGPGPRADGDRRREGAAGVQVPAARVLPEKDPSGSPPAGSWCWSWVDARTDHRHNQVQNGPGSLCPQRESRKFPPGDPC